MLPSSFWGISRRRGHPANARSLTRGRPGLGTLKKARTRPRPLHRHAFLRGLTGAVPSAWLPIPTTARAGRPAIGELERCWLADGRMGQSRTAPIAQLSGNPEVRFHRPASLAIDRQDILGTRREGDDEIHFRTQPHVAAR